MCLHCRGRIIDSDSNDPPEITERIPLDIRFANEAIGTKGLDYRFRKEEYTENAPKSSPLQAN